MKTVTTMRPATIWAEWFVPKDATEAYTKTVVAWIERIQKDAIAHHPESYVKKLRKLNIAMCAIRNMRPAFIGGKTDHQETVRQIKRIVEKATKL